MITAKKFASFVTYKIEQKNLCISQIAKNGNISRAHIYLIKDGACVPTLEKAGDILLSIGETWDSLLEYAREVA